MILNINDKYGLTSSWYCFGTEEPRGTCRWLQGQAKKAIRGLSVAVFSGQSVAGCMQLCDKTRGCASCQRQSDGICELKKETSKEVSLIDSPSFTFYERQCKGE